MNEAHAQTWMRRLAADTPPPALPPFEQVELRARLEAAFEAGRRVEASLDWIEAAWQSSAICGAVVLAVALGDLFS
jgi:hypothetical protein